MSDFTVCQEAFWRSGSPDNCFPGKGVIFGKVLFLVKFTSSFLNNIMVVSMHSSVHWCHWCKTTPCLSGFEMILGAFKLALTWCQNNTCHHFWLASPFQSTIANLPWVPTPAIKSEVVIATPLRYEKSTSSSINHLSPSRALASRFRSVSPNLVGGGMATTRHNNNSKPYFQHHWLVKWPPPGPRKEKTLKLFLNTSLHPLSYDAPSCQHLKT